MTVSRPMRMTRGRTEASSMARYYLADCRPRSTLLAYCARRVGSGRRFRRGALRRWLRLLLLLVLFVALRQRVDAGRLQPRGFLGLRHIGGHRDADLGMQHDPHPM